MLSVDSDQVIHPRMARFWRFSSPWRLATRWLMAGSPPRTVRSLGTTPHTCGEPQYKTCSTAIRCQVAELDQTAPRCRHRPKSGGSAILTKTLCGDDARAAALYVGDFPRQLLSSDVQASLRSEADDLRVHAGGATIARFHLHDDGSLRGKRRVRVATGGARLHELHHTVGLDAARRASNVQLYPTRACYLYYEPGDYALLHHDVSQCTVTLLACVAGDAEPLILYPSFGRATESDIEALNAAPVCDRVMFESYLADHIDPARLSAVSLEPTADLIVAQRGRDIPHARYPQDSPVTMAALCYAALVHHPAWLAV
jgi:hypothetical protein